jgi:glycosyltransferase involved in cell wall biosynthesis
MRILHWFPNFFAGGGISNSVLALARTQAAIAADAEVLVVSNRHGRAAYGAMDLGAAVRAATWDGTGRVSLGGLQVQGMGSRTRQNLRALAPDVVHVHGEFNPDNWWTPILWKVPIVLSPHGAFHPTVMKRGARGKSAYVSIARRLLYRKVSAFHALNPAEQADIGDAISRASTYCVPQGPSPAVQQALVGFTPIGKADEGPVRIMFIGRIDVETKGLDILVEAFASATRNGLAHSTVLVLAGPDWHEGKSALSRLADRLGVRNRVQLPDAVPADGIVQLLGDCDIYAQLSRNEGSPLSLNDALALGKPAIVSSHVGTASCPELAHLAHVRLIEPDVSQAADAIAHCVTNLRSLESAAREGHSAMSDFLSWETAARSHLARYASLLQG